MPANRVVGQDPNHLKNGWQTAYEGEVYGLGEGTENPARCDSVCAMAQSTSLRVFTNPDLTPFSVIQQWRLQFPSSSIPLHFLLVLHLQP
ncbi:hypothetical protein COP2_009669 [Malus domestica]